MRSVYMGSWVTLVAAASKDSGNGLFCQQNFATACAFKLGPDAGKLAGTWIASNETKSSTTDSKKEPLASRGWAFQESVLSRRIISFTFSQIRWGCLEFTDCEFRDLRTQLQSNELYEPAPLSPLAISLKDYSWTKLVAQYNENDFTFYSDKLAAFAGVAEEYSILNKFEPTQYAAGLLVARHLAAPNVVQSR